MRCILLVMDSVGVGELTDAYQYGDRGSNTLGNIAKAVGGLSLPTLESLGLGNITKIQGVKPKDKPQSAYGKCAEISVGKDTMTGHWEIMGIKLDKPFPTYPDGFPDEIIRPFEEAIGRKAIGNRPASGTEIIKELGEEHLKTGHLIVYTSVDSVFQIAAHKEKIPLEGLYAICRKARTMLKAPHNVARVIARPFIGEPNTFVRTPERKDFTVSPPENILDLLLESGVKVVGIGKISEIFAGRGINKGVHGTDNDDLMHLTMQEFKGLKSGLVFTNLVDFDMLWGHRNDTQGYAEALVQLDEQLPRLIDLLESDDLLFITADHGCDPTTPSTDHSREYVPLLAIGARVKKGVNLGVRSTFADIGQTIAELFDVKGTGVGTSFFKEIATPR